jgi:predicted PhzF superfamily epimerase YddE/YHI9
MAVYATEAEVRALTPDMARVQALGVFAIMATAPADPALSPGADFVSRFFAPGAGVGEDPVTGSAHCTLVPYWAGRLGKHTLEARQVSRRGGALRCVLDADRVRMTGRAVCYLEGHIEV